MRVSHAVAPVRCLSRRGRVRVSHAAAAVRCLSRRGPGACLSRRGRGACFSAAVCVFNGVPFTLYPVPCTLYTVPLTVVPRSAPRFTACDGRACLPCALAVQKW